MSILLNHSLADAIAMQSGVIPANIWPQNFPVDGLSLWRLKGLAAAPGHAELDSDLAWESVVRSWWGLGVTWGLCAVGKAEGIEWNLVLPDNIRGTHEAVATHLTGSNIEQNGEFRSLSSRFGALPFRGAMGGNPGIGSDARLESAMRSLLGSEFMVFILAKALPRPTIEAELRRLSGEEQFVRDEHLSRGGLENDSHTGATRYLRLLEAARDRAVSASQEGGWLVRTLVAAPDQGVFNQACSLIHGGFSLDGGQPEPLRWQETSDVRSLTFLRSAEAAALSRPPRREMPGFIVETNVSESSASQGHSSPAIFATAPSATNCERPIAAGSIVNDQGKSCAWLELDADDLSRHVLVAGMPGSGKSVTCEHLLLEIWREHRIPWLVIEPGMKPGYRRLKNSEIGDDIDACAIGDPKSRRLALNPMAAPPGIGLAEHTSALFTVISSAFELVAPMPEVLAAAIEQTYRRHGWDLAGLVPNSLPPTLSDLVQEIDRSTSALGYGSEITGNIRAGLLLRMRRLLEGPLAPELAAPTGLDVTNLVKRPTIIELSALTDASSQALVMGLISLQLRHHWRLAGLSDSLRHVLLIEEAHRLLKTVPETSANAARTQAVESLAYMLAEMRGFGVGMVIVDQTPSALVSSVIANTGTKIIHRLDHPSDRELAGRAAGIPAGQIDLLGTLSVGDAILRTDRRTRPFRVRMPNPSVTYGRMPMHSLPAPEKQLSAKCCSVCGAPGCRAALNGSRESLRRLRLTTFLAIIGSSSSSSMEDALLWASSELERNGFGTSSNQHRVCFLIGLAESSGLSAETIRRIKEAFRQS